MALRSPDPRDAPIIDHNYLAHPLEMLMLAEDVRFAKEIVMEGRGIRDVAKARSCPVTGSRSRRESSGLSMSSIEPQPATIQPERVVSGMIVTMRRSCRSTVC